MFTDVKRFVDFMIKNEINERQFLLCYLLHADLEIINGKKYYESSYANSERPISSIYKLTNHYKSKYNTVAWTQDDIKLLEEKGFIKILGSKYSPDMLELQEPFMQLLTNETDFDEFWNTYPSFIPPFNDKGAYVKLKNVNKESLAYKYKRKVISKDMHARIMDILRWSVENKQISLSIVNYVDNQYWFEDEKLRLTMKEPHVGVPTQKRA
jgi:hypothetical protein